MIEYVTNLKDFWSKDLESYSFLNLVNVAQREYFHSNYARETNNILQGFDDELPECRHQFFKSLGIDKGSISWICMQPCQVIPVHTDNFYKLRTQHSVDITECVRYLVFLQDWVFGHFVQFDEQVITNWTKGDVWRFDHDSPHWAVNASQTSFVTCQVNTLLNNISNSTHKDTG
jgi:hypothetical protein